jgi:tRNA(adenine34) deaminase
MASEHEIFMRAALEEATRGGAEGNIAIGSVVVRNGVVVGGRNLEAVSGDPTTHAEVVAVREASRALGRSGLAGAALYTTWEPCPMCCGAIMTSGITTLVMGARHEPATTRWGGFTVERLLELTGWAGRLAVISGILPDECRRLWADWEARRGAASRPASR